MITIIFAGTKTDCQREYNKIEIESSKWGGVEIVAPGQTVSSDMLIPLGKLERPSGDFSSLIERENLWSG